MPEICRFPLEDARDQYGHRDNDGNDAGHHVRELLDGGEDQRRIGAAEAEGIGERRFYIAFLRDVGDEIEFGFHIRDDRG